MAILLGLVLSCTDPAPRIIDDDVQRSAAAFSYASLDVRPVTFVIDNRRDTFLWGRNDVLLYIPAEAFLTEQDNHQVELYLKTYTQPGESLAQDIAMTTADQRLLTSCTILHVEARQGQDALRLVPRKELRLHIIKPTQPIGELSLWSGQPHTWQPIDYDRPKLFNHMLKIGPYKEEKFADGQSIIKWEKDHLYISLEEEQMLWHQEPYLHLRYSINEQGMIEEVSFKEPIKNDFQRRILQEMASYPRCRPYLVDGKPERVVCEYAFHVHQAEPKYREDNAYIQAIERNQSVLNTHNIDHIDDLELKYCIFNTKQLGWMAIAEAQAIEQSVDLIVELEPDVFADVKVLLSDSKAIVRGIRQGNEVLFRGLPKDKAIRVIALGNRANQPVYAEAFANSSDGVLESLPFEATSYEEIRSAIRQVNHARQ